MKYFIDRIESGIAVCYGENRVDKFETDIKNLPDNAKIGDTLIVDSENISIDKLDSEKRQQRIDDLMNDLFN